MTPREDDDDDRVDDAIAVRDRALARRGAFLREPALVVRPPRTRGDFSRGVDARSRGGWGPLLARPREIRAGTFVSARPSRPSSRGTPCPRGTRTRRSRSRGSRTTPRRGTTARYARARPRSRRRTPPRRETLAWHAHASQPGAFFRRVALECVEHPARHRGGRREDISHLLFSRLASASRAPSVLRASLRLFRRKKCVRVFPTDPFSTHITHVHARMHTRTHSPHRSKRRCPRSARRARRRFATT